MISRPTSFIIHIKDLYHSDKKKIRNANNIKKYVLPILLVFLLLEFVFLFTPNSQLAIN